MTTLAKSEGVRLSDLEATVERGLETFVEVGEALRLIRDDRLYRAEYRTFEEYCSGRWGMSNRHANRTIEASGVVQVLGPIGPVPANEAQARELARLQDKPERLARAWQEATKRAQAGGRRVTASDVRAAVRSRLPEPAPRREPDHTRVPDATPAPPPASSDHQEERVEAALRRVREWGDGADVEADPERWLAQLLSTKETINRLIERARRSSGEAMTAEKLEHAEVMAERLGVELK